MTLAQSTSDDTAIFDDLAEMVTDNQQKVDESLGNVVIDEFPGSDKFQEIQELVNSIDKSQDTNEFISLGAMVTGGIAVTLIVACAVLAIVGAKRFKQKINTLIGVNKKGTAIETEPETKI